MDVNLGDYIRTRRKALEKTLREFAESIGIDFVLLSKIEQGRVNPDAETLRKIAGGLLSDKAFKELAIAAQVPDVVFSVHPLSDDAPMVAELLPLGFIQSEHPGWYEVSEAGYQFIEAQGIGVWRFSLAVAA